MDRGGVQIFMPIRPHVLWGLQLNKLTLFYTDLSDLSLIFGRRNWGQQKIQYAMKLTFKIEKKKHPEMSLSFFSKLFKKKRGVGWQQQKDPLSLFLLFKFTCQMKAL